MPSCSLLRLFGILLLVLGLCSVRAAANEYRYQYISLSGRVPAGYGCFSPLGGVTDDGRVYGTVVSPIPEFCDEPTGEEIPHLALYSHSAISVLRSYNAATRLQTANRHGHLGGSVFDPKNNVWRAALFYGQRAQIIPRLSATELEGYVAQLTDSGIALVVSVNRSGWPPVAGDWAYALYKNGRLTRLDFGPELVLPWMLQINNQGVIAGVKMIRPLDPAIPDQAFKFDPRSSDLTRLDPVPPDTFSWSRDINNRGEVLGYSFSEFGAPARIGIWNRSRPFATLFDESREGFVSDRLCFNDHRLIVLSGFSDDFAYLVPRPGVLLDLADVSQDLPATLLKKYVYVANINNRGDVLASGNLFDSLGNYIRGDTFLLKRLTRGPDPCGDRRFGCND